MRENVKVFRIEHYDYANLDQSGSEAHQLLLDTMNYHLPDYPIPTDESIFLNPTSSFFKEKEVAEEFHFLMGDHYDDYEEDYEHLDNQTPEDYGIEEVEIDKMDIVYSDRFQIITSKTA